MISNPRDVHSHNVSGGRRPPPMRGACSGHDPLASVGGNGKPCRPPRFGFDWTNRGRGALCVRNLRHSCAADPAPQLGQGDYGNPRRNDRRGAVRRRGLEVVVRRSRIRRLKSQRDDAAERIITRLAGKLIDCIPRSLASCSSFRWPLAGLPTPEEQRAAAWADRP